MLLPDEINCHYLYSPRINKKNITQDPKHIKKLKPYARLISSLCKKSQSIKSRKRVLQKGGFVPTLLTTLIPLVAQLVATKRKK